MMLCAHSYYVTPTVLTDVTDDMDIWKEEVFGPVRHPPIQSKWGRAATAGFYTHSAVVCCSHTGALHQDLQDGGGGAGDG